MEGEKIHVDEIIQTVEKLCIEANYDLGEDIMASFKKARIEEALTVAPKGFGGTTTALAVNLKVYPTQISSLPVAVNISCHATRHKEARFRREK
ncbi:MAG: hypothetical protein VR66_05915 [Peptococcaceae bacterium BRH_c23]|nr:MAG: hypothetical protein VR66_05915 [Peptococcaceae bacterium BRH_c23]KJS84224.1 MAG: hypothetical protein JL57_20905 [Desulfosporosinus sp. BICA1-9]HBW37702.1 hypothetical protein [Desulfosporosinus sp.]